MNETLKILKERRSVRRYEARPVEREKLDAILEAGKYAPSAKGQQSVTMVVLTKREDIAELSALNATMGNLMNAAWSLGVASCWINRAEEVFAELQGKALLRRWGLPERLMGVGNCILGYAAGEIPAPKPRKDGWILRV